MYLWPFAISKLPKLWIYTYQVFIGGNHLSDYAVIAVDDFNFTPFSRDCPKMPQTSTSAPTTTDPDQGVSIADRTLWDAVYFTYVYCCCWMVFYDSHTLSTKWLSHSFFHFLFSFQSVSCNFTEGPCGWKNDPDNKDVQWSYNGQSTISIHYSIPSIKYSVNTCTHYYFILHLSYFPWCPWTENENYMWLEMLGGDLDGYYQASILSPSFTVPVGEAICFTVTWMLQTETEAHFSIITQGFVWWWYFVHFVGYMNYN